MAELPTFPKPRRARILRALLKTLLLWLLMLALPLQAVTLAEMQLCGSVPACAAAARQHAPAAHGAHQDAAQPCQTGAQAQPDTAPGDGGHAGPCAACCPAAAPALLQFDRVSAPDLRCGAIAYTPAYLPRVTPEPPEHPPRSLSL